MIQFLQGAVAASFLVVALHFLRFFRQTRDALFLLFALSFLVQAATQTIFAFVASPTESRPALYLPRLVAYALIIVAVASKNVRRGGR